MPQREREKERAPLITSRRSKGITDFYGQLGEFFIISPRLLLFLRLPDLFMQRRKLIFFRLSHRADKEMGGDSPGRR